MKYLMFSKPLGSLAIPEMCERMKSMGFDGADLTVRKGGHVDTESGGDLAGSIRDAARQVSEAGMSLGMLTTNLRNASDPIARPIFEAAAESDVKLIKLGYWDYKQFGSLQQRIDEARRDLDSIEKLATQTGVCGVVHNHSGGSHLTAVIPTVAKLLEGRNPEAVACYLDTGHIVAEGVAGSWIQTLDLVIDRVRVLGAKSYGFYPEQDEASGQKVWKRKAASYEEGIVPWKQMLSLIKQSGFDGPASFHCEYAGDLDAQMRQLQEDFDYFKRTLETV